MDFQNQSGMSLEEKLKMDEVINDVKIFDNQDIEKNPINSPKKTSLDDVLFSKIREKLNSLKKDKIFK